MSDIQKRRIITIIGVASIVVLFACGVTYRKELWAVFTQEQAREQLVQTVQNTGMKGVLLFLGIQIIQVVAAFLPGEPVELMAGMLYGAWGGMLFCLIGILLGSFLIYAVVKVFRVQAVSPEVLQKYAFLRNPARVKLLLFLLFFIPGTPKDFLTYLAPLLPVKMATFLSIATLARIPSVLSSTLAADAFFEGNKALGIGIYLIIGSIAALCIWQENNIIKYAEKVSRYF